MEDPSLCWSKFPHNCNVILIHKVLQFFNLNFLKKAKMNNNCIIKNLNKKHKIYKIMRQQKLTQTAITRITGVCGILLPIVVFTSIGLAMGHAPWFSWTQHALSDLGIKGMPALLFNSGVILGGILAFVFSLGLIKTLSNKSGAYILGLSSIALIGIGVFPETEYLLHLLVSASFFVLLILALLIIGLTIKQNQFERNMGVLAAFFAFLAIASTVLLIPWEGIAIPESFSCFPAFIWCMIFGVKMAFR